MLTGEVAKRAGVNTETLRFYERKGLLAPPKRLQSGYRVYSADAVRTVRFIKRAQQLGFTLQEIKTLLELSVHRRASCKEVQTLADQKVGEVDEKIRDLLAIKAALEQLLGSCHGDDHRKDCPLLKAIEQTSVARAEHQPY
ncbi:MAG: heavy metal-responsive transcriptional regulator [Candidatus Saccharimonadales bacterium]